MKKGVLFLFVLTLAVLLIALAEAAPKRRGGGGRKSSGGWFGSKKKTYGSNYGGNTYKKKNKFKSNLKKAAVIGATAYGSYQIGKLVGRFGSGGYGYGHGHGGNYGFNDWNRWREIDGFMCRDSNDCNWIDSRLYCQDYELDFQPSALWFGGDAARIVGECACPHGMVWDDYEMECEMAGFGIGMIFVFIIVVLILLCCCAGGAFLIVRRLF